MYFFSLVVGYFADAQYDVLFFTCHCEPQARQTPGRVKVYGAYFPFFFRGIAAGCLAYSFDTPTICGLITIAVWLIVSAIAAIIFNKKAK